MTRHVVIIAELVEDGSLRLRSWLVFSQWLPTVAERN